MWRRRPLVRRRPLAHCALEEREVFLRDLHGVRLVLGEQVHDAIRHLEGHGPHFLRRVDAEAPAFDHGRAAHRHGGALGGDDDVAAGHQRRVAGERAAVDDADEGHEARKLREAGEGVGVEGNPRSAAVVPRPAAATLAEEDQRDAEPMRQFEHAVLLVVVSSALGAGQNRVVIVHQHGAGIFLAEEVCIHGADASDEAVRRSVAAQGFHVVAAVLAGDHERPVLLEAALVHQLVDVLARHPIAPAIALGHRLRAVLVQDVGVALVGLREVRTDVVGVQLCRCQGGVARDFRLFDEDDRISLAHHVALGHRHLPDDAVVLGGDDVFHLHRFHHGNLLPGAHLVARRHVKRDDRALDGRANAGSAIRALHRRQLRRRSRLG